jgi:TonB family protein
MRCSFRFLAACALSCALSCVLAAALPAPLHASPRPQEQPQHVQPGQLAQPTPLPQPTPLKRIPPTPEYTATSLEEAAQKVGEILDGFQSTRIAVFEFARPQREEWNRVGQQLAADFRAQLYSAAPGVAQMSRDDIAKLCKQHNVTQEDAVLLYVPNYVLNTSSLDAWVIATIDPIGGSMLKITFTIRAMQLKPGAYRHDMARIELRTPRTPELDAMIDPPTPPPPPAFTGVPESGDRGYGFAACEYCPQAQYTDEAVKAQLQGVVYFRITIEPTGKAGQIHVLRRLPLGLTESAEKALREWRFTPALGPDGQPAEVAETVEIQFQLF